MKSFFTLRESRAYFWRILVSLDQLVLNVVLGPIWNGLTLLEARIYGTNRANLHRYGFPDETLSSVFYKNRTLSPMARFFDTLLDAIDPGHGKDANEPDEGRRFKP